MDGEEEEEENDQGLLSKTSQVVSELQLAEKEVVTRTKELSEETRAHPHNIGKRDRGILFYSDPEVG